MISSWSPESLGSKRWEDSMPSRWFPANGTVGGLLGAALRKTGINQPGSKDRERLALSFSPYKYLTLAGH